MNKKYFDLVTEKLNLYFAKKAPAMPESVKEFIVKYSPYLTIIMMLIAVPAIIATLGLTSSLSSLAYLTSSYYRPIFYIQTVFSVVALVLEGMAIPGLFKRTKKAWFYMFYSSLVVLLSELIGFNLFNLLINAVISFYILFQIRSYYKN